MMRHKESNGIGLGSLKLPIRGSQHYLVYGGPYWDKPPNMPGVKMAEEIHWPCEVSIPTKDFDVPDMTVLDSGLRKAITLILKGEAVYVGCAGGRGRTGLFLSILAKAFRIKSPVPYVRDKYYSHAVETKEQYNFVTKYRVPRDIAIKIRFYQLWSFLRQSECLTRIPS